MVRLWVGQGHEHGMVGAPKHLTKAADVKLQCTLLLCYVLQDGLRIVNTS